VLVAFSHGPARIEAAKARFLSAVAICFLIWVVGTCLCIWLGYPRSWYDVLASIAILFTATVAWGMLWSLVCWGFTTSLLAALFTLDGPASREVWFRAYGGGSSIVDFADNRLSILLALGLAKTDGTTVALSGKAGKLMALVVLSLRNFYGIPNE
jgi:hypothetical protein